MAICATTQNNIYVAVLGRETFLLFYMVQVSREDKIKN